MNLTKVRLFFGLIGIFMVFLIVIFSSCGKPAAAPPAPPAPENYQIIVAGKKVDALKQLQGHWRTHNNAFFVGEESLFFSNNLVKNLVGGSASLKLFESRNSDADNMFSAYVFDPKNSRDPNSSDFSMGPLPFMLAIDKDTNAVTISIYNFASLLWRKQVIKFSGDLKSYKSVDYDSSGATNGKIQKYYFVDASVKP